MSEGAVDAQNIKCRYKVVEHTADIGIEVESKTLAGLFALSACAMFDLMIDLSEVRPRQKAIVSLRADSQEELLVTWLNELVFIRPVPYLATLYLSLNCIIRCSRHITHHAPSVLFPIIVIAVPAFIGSPTHAPSSCPTPVVKSSI